MAGAAVLIFNPRKKRISRESGNVGENTNWQVICDLNNQPHERQKGVSVTAIIVNREIMSTEKDGEMVRTGWKRREHGTCEVKNT